MILPNSIWFPRMKIFAFWFIGSQGFNLWYSTLAQVMPWCWIGAKPLPDPTMTKFNQTDMASPGDNELNPFAPTHQLDNLLSYFTSPSPSSTSSSHHPIIFTHWDTMCHSLNHTELCTNNLKWICVLIFQWHKPWHVQSHRLALLKSISWGTPIELS